MTNMKVGIVGAGASGLMLAGLLKKKGFDVYVFDKNEKCGKKLYITGKGRCNLTNYCLPDEFLKNVVRGEKFLRSAIYNFPPSECVKFFNDLGLETKVERGNRVFPKSDKSSDVIKTLFKFCEGVKFKFCEDVKSITFNGDFCLRTKVKEYHFDKVVIATGGASYSSTGSDGSGYKLAKSFGHSVEEIRSALCPIKLKDDVSSLQGVSLKNVAINADADKKKIHFFGEMMFTDIGITGPIVLSLSSLINRALNVQIFLDLKPALDEKTLDARLLRDFDENKNKNFLFILKGLMPQALCKFFTKKCEIFVDKKVHDITKEERVKVVKTLKNLPLSYNGLYPLETGIVTSGGVKTAEINPKTFESKLQNGLYFVGEVLDLDALTGGFNLQIAFATSYMCALNM